VQDTHKDGLPRLDSIDNFCMHIENLNDYGMGLYSL